MSTLMLKPIKSNVVPLSADFVDHYMPKAKGEYVKVYILLKRYILTGEMGVTTTFLADTLDIMERDVLKALEYWHDIGLLHLTTYDGAGNFSVELTDQRGHVAPQVETAKPAPERAPKPASGGQSPLFKEIEALMSRPLSTHEMDRFLYFKEEYRFPDEVMILLVQHCVSKGISDMRYMEKVAISWHSQGITNTHLAQENIKKHEDKWSNYRKVLTYLGLSEREVMKPQEDLLEKWFYAYRFSTEMILKACDISFNNLGKGELKYIDGILRVWLENDVKTLEEIETKGKNPKSTTPKKKKKPTDFVEREYDYEDLERKLLGWDKQ